MRIQIGIILLIGFLLASCSSTGTISTTPTAPIKPYTPTVQNTPTLVLPANTGGEILPQETAISNCANEDANKIARAIADSYSFTTTEEVISWFCKGAEFEDIMVALETEELNGTAAEDMLQMRAEGLSWEEIWQVVGFYKK